MHFLLLREAEHPSHGLLLKGLGLGEGDHTDAACMGRAVGVDDDDVVSHL